LRSIKAVDTAYPYGHPRTPLGLWNPWRPSHRWWGRNEHNFAQMWMSTFVVKSSHARVSDSCGKSRSMGIPCPTFHGPNLWIPIRRAHPPYRYPHSSRVHTNRGYPVSAVFLEQMKHQKYVGSQLTRGWGTMWPLH